MGLRQQRSAAADRFAALSIAAGVILGLLYLATALAERSNLVPALIVRAVPAAAMIAGGVSLGWIGSRVGTLLLRLNDLSRQVSSAANDHISDFRQIADRLEALSAATPGGAAGAAPTAAASPAPADESVDPDALPDPLPMPVPEPEVVVAAAPPSPPPNAPPEPGAPALNDRIIILLEEIREAALMDDEQRRKRLQQLRDERRRAGLDHVAALARDGRWTAGDRHLAALESQFAGDPLVAEGRAEFQRARQAAEPDALFHTEQRVRELVQAGAWDRAVALTNEFLGNFPASGDGRRLLAEVHREYEAYRDSTLHRLYEKVQSDVDRRQWRSALGDAQRLLELFPDHARAARIRQQLKTIAANAEIEERQEQEVQIQLLIKGQRFAEAVELAEELIRRFPGSPQADALEARLPQLREIADLGDGNGI